MTSAETAPNRTRPLLSVKGLVKTYPSRGGGVWSRDRVRAVDGVDLELAQGETLSVVGESGCGKTTLGRSILRLETPDRGEVRFHGPDEGQVRDVSRLRGRALREIRREMQIVFQDPYSSLNPRLRVEALVGEALTAHGIASGDERRQMVVELLAQVGLDRGAIDRYPHEFSGGQRQRIGIARALALSPRLIVCDEAVSALDVSVQAQIVNLLRDLQEERGLSYLFISHDLSVVRHVSHRVIVMYLGTVVETAPAGALFDGPRHPYSQALLSAVPARTPSRKTGRIVLTGDLPSPSNPPSGCRFHTRCPVAEARCSTEEPPVREAGVGHSYRCHLEG